MCRFRSKVQASVVFACDIGKCDKRTAVYRLASRGQQELARIAMLPLALPVPSGTSPHKNDERERVFRHMLTLHRGLVSACAASHVLSKEDRSANRWHLEVVNKQGKTKDAPRRCPTCHNTIARDLPSPCAYG